MALLHSSKPVNLPSVQSVGQYPCITRRDAKPAEPAAGQNVRNVVKTVRLASPTPSLAGCSLTASYPTTASPPLHPSRVHRRAVGSGGAVPPDARGLPFGNSLPTSACFPSCRVERPQFSPDHTALWRWRPNSHTTSFLGNSAMPRPPSVKPADQHSRVEPPFCVFHERLKSLGKLTPDVDDHVLRIALLSILLPPFEKDVI
mgnify:CR=1 FL=1